MKLLQIRPHVRRAPKDPYAPIREQTTKQLREEVALIQLNADLRRIFEPDDLDRLLETY